MGASRVHGDGPWYDDHGITGRRASGNHLNNPDTISSHGLSFSASVSASTSEKFRSDLASASRVGRHLYEAMG